MSGSYILFIRHAERNDIPEGIDGDLIGLTEKGRADALSLGKKILETGVSGSGVSGPVKFVSSPIGRCVDTARLIMQGMGEASEVQISDHFLYGYIIDKKVAFAAINDVGYQQAMYEYIKKGSYPGFRDLDEGSRLILSNLRTCAQGHSLICVSHDVLTLPFLAYYVPDAIKTLKNGWIGFMQGSMIVEGSTDPGSTDPGSAPGSNLVRFFSGSIDPGADTEFF